MNKILVVEDTKSIQDLLRAKLEREKFEVITVDNGKEAVAEIIHDSEISLILLDVMMPVMDGKEFLKKHFQICFENNIKVCMLTALDDEESINECLELGAVDYLVKPVDNELLLEKIDIILSDNHGGRFASVKTNLGIEISKGDDRGEGRMFYLSENRSIFNTELELETSDVVTLRSQKLSEIIGSEFVVVARVLLTKKEKGEKNYLVEFVGLSESRMKRIRSLTISGSELVDC